MLIGLSTLYTPTYLHSWIELLAYAYNSSATAAAGNGECEVIEDSIDLWHK